MPLMSPRLELSVENGPTADTHFLARPHTPTFLTFSRARKPRGGCPWLFLSIDYPSRRIARRCGSANAMSRSMPRTVSSWKSGTRRAPLLARRLLDDLVDIPAGVTFR
jgi:hypothetical protein